MSELASQPAPRLRTWRPMAAWTGAILLVLGLVWFVAAVVVPVWQVRVQLRGIPIESKFQLPAHNMIAREVHDLAMKYADLTDMPDRQVEARKIRTYLRLPPWAAPEQWKAAMLLRWCGSDGQDVMVEALQHRDPGVRFWAAQSLGRSSLAEPDDVARALQEAQNDPTGGGTAAPAPARKETRGGEAGK